MSTWSKILWGALALAAVVFVTAAVTKEIVTARWAATHPAAVAETRASEAPCDATAEPAPPVAETAGASEEAAAARTAEPQASPAAGAGAGFADLDLEALAGNLTADELGKLESELQKVRGERFRLAARYQMPSDLPFFSLGLAGRTKPELRLSEDQQSRLKALEDAQKALLDARLSRVWARMDEVHRQLAAEGTTGGLVPATQGQDDPRLAELKDLYDQEAAAKAEYDKEYESQRLGVLTDTQREFVEARKAEFARFIKAAQ